MSYNTFVPLAPHVGGVNFKSYVSLPHALKYGRGSGLGDVPYNFKSEFRIDHVLKLCVRGRRSLRKEFQNTESYLISHAFKVRSIRYFLQ